MEIVGIWKCSVFSIRSSWRFACRHPFVMSLLLFVLFLYICFPSIFAFVVCSSPVIACTAALLGALLVYGESEDEKDRDVSVKVGSADVNLMKGERYFSEEYVKNSGVLSAAKVAHERLLDDGLGKDDMNLDASSSRKITEKEGQTKKTVTNMVEFNERDLIEKELSSIENPVGSSLRIVEGLKVEIKKPLDNQFESSLGSPWQQVNDPITSSDSTESERSDGEESLSPDASITDLVPIIDELHPLLESGNPIPGHRSIDTFDSVCRASSSEHEDDCSADDETENVADEEDEEAQEEKTNSETVVSWTADDQKNLMDLGSSELERNQRLENLIAKRRARTLQRFQTDKNLIDLETEPFPFMSEILKLNVQIPAIFAPKSNPFDMHFDSEGSLGLLPVPNSAPSVLLPRRNPFDFAFDQSEKSNKLAGESSRSYDVSISQTDTLPMRIDALNHGTVSDDVSHDKDDPKLTPYFVAEKMSGSSSSSLKGESSEESDLEESSSSGSDLASAVINQEHQSSERETHEHVSFLNLDAESVEHERDLSVEVGSLDHEHEHNGADTVKEEIEEFESSSPDSSNAHLEVIDERYDGSSSSSCYGEDDKCNEAIHIETFNSDQQVANSLRSLGQGAEEIDDILIAEPGFSIKDAQRADDSQAVDPVYDSSPSTKPVPHISSPGKEGLLDLFSTKRASEKGSTSEEGEFILVRESTHFLPLCIDDKFGQNRSVDGASDSGINIVKNFHVEELMLDNRVQELEPKLSEKSDSRFSDSCAGSPVPSVGDINDSAMQSSKKITPESTV